MPGIFLGLQKIGAGALFKPPEIREVFGI